MKILPKHNIQLNVLLLFNQAQFIKSIVWLVCLIQQHTSLFNPDFTKEKKKKHNKNAISLKMFYKAIMKSLSEENLPNARSFVQSWSDTECKLRKTMSCNIFCHVYILSLVHHSLNHALQELKTK